MKNKSHTINDTKGFTLVELIVAMAVFMVVLIIASQAFDTIITSSSKYAKSEESNIEGMIGLEMMRHDLEQMGFGLPWGFGGNVTYAESTQSLASMNDAPSGTPRPFVGYHNFSSAVFGVKGSTVGTTKASQKWSYISFNNYSANPRESRPVNLGHSSPKSGDRVISLLTSFNSDTKMSLLLSSGTYDFNYDTNNGIPVDFLPKGDQETAYIYGVGDTALRMPFNRADFFIKKSSGVPSFCAPNTGVLYKASVNHADGNYTEIPLLDCVASMQVVLGWSSNTGTENIQDSLSTYSSLPDTSGNLSVIAAGPTSPIDASVIAQWFANKDAQRIREQLKVVKVYILAQEGKRDLKYTYPSPNITIGGGGEGSLTRIYNFTNEQRGYRWKLYRIFVKPRNLISNQR